jgi:alkylation response protein AidB-like acyl-CoA dehydrogenase
VRFDLTPEQGSFVRTTQQFLAKKYPPQKLRDLRDSPSGFDRDLWKQGAELGWTSLLVADSDGGGNLSGEGLRDLALVAFQFGRHASPGPLLPANVVAAALSMYGTAEHKATELRGILSGERVATWCSTSGMPTTSSADQINVQKTGSGLRLDGRIALVEAAAQADSLLVVARDDEGLTQIIVSAQSPGISINPFTSLDVTRRFAEVIFDGVHVAPSAVLGTQGHAESSIERLSRIAIAIELSEIVGAMERAFELTRDWSFSRYTFGRPLASYQALKHRFADMKMWLEASRSIADAATDSVERDAPDASELVSAGKAYISEFGPALVQDCVQLHGAIGLTFEYDLNLYMRRVIVGSTLYGSPFEHYNLLTKILERTEPAE